MSWFSNIVSGIGNSLSSVPIVGDIAQGISSAVGGIEAESQHAKDKAWQANQAQLNRNFQREERIASQEYNEKMWHMNNEYNSPANQIKLAQEAGINPGSLFGSASGGFVSSQPVKTTASPGSMASAPGSIASTMLTSGAQVASLLEGAQGQSIQNDFAPKLNDSALRKAEAEIAEIGARKGFTEQQTEQIKQMLPLLKGKTRAEIYTMQKQWEVFRAQIKSADTQSALNDEKATYELWKNMFIKDFGVSPESGLIDGIIQLATSGDKGLNIASAMLNTLFSTAIGAIITFDSRTSEGTGGKSFVDFLGSMIRGFFGF